MTPNEAFAEASLHHRIPSSNSPIPRMRYNGEAERPRAGLAGASIGFRSYGVSSAHYPCVHGPLQRLLEVTLPITTVRVRPRPRKRKRQSRQVKRAPETPSKANPRLARSEPGATAAVPMSLGRAPPAIKAAASRTRTPGTPNEDACKTVEWVAAAEIPRRRTQGRLFFFVELRRPK